MVEKHGKGKGKEKHYFECWNRGKRGHYSKDCWSKMNTNKGGSKGKYKSKNATDAHNLDSTKPANGEPEVEIGGFDMSLNGSKKESTQVQERRHGPRVSHMGRSFLVMLTSFSAQRLESLSEVASECKLRVVTIGVPISGFEVFVCKPLLSVGEYATTGGVTVLYGDKGYMFHKGSNVGDERFTILRLYSCV